MKEYKVYWWENESAKNNWGDVVNRYIISKMSNKPIESIIRDTESPGVLRAIGSVMHHGIKEGDTIWGTGSIHNAPLPKDLNLDIRAVRGPLTRSLLIKNGYECPEIYGDPALLMPRFYNPTVERTNIVGIIPHFSEIDNPITISMLERHPYLKLIDIRLGYEEFIDSLKSVEYVLSSSLHGLIAADAYGIKNAKIDIPGPQHKGNAWKYMDYFASVNRMSHLGNVLTMTTKLQDLTDAAKWNHNIDIDLDSLVDSFPSELFA